MRAQLTTLWPGGLVGRVIIVLLGALALEFVGSTLLYEQTAALLPSTETLDDLAARLVRTERALSAVSRESRPHLAEAVSDDLLRLEWHEASPATGVAVDPPLPLTLLRVRLIRLQPGLAARQLTLRSGAKADGGILQNVSGTVSLADGSLLGFSARRLTEDRQDLYGTLLSAALFAGGVLLAAAITVHTLGAPLRRLARVAGAIGHGPPIAVAEKRGPREIRQVARALNAMQRRIAALVNDRTEALAAVSHDLRTPISRMRLRVETLDPGETTRAIEGDLAEMEQMIATVLAFLNGESDPEPRRPVDLASILTTLVDDATDRGAEASYEGPDRCRISARPLEIKRALSNLVDNAIRYGGMAQVTLAEAALAGRPAVRVMVVDAGPGVPEAELERVFEPFHRVDASRNAGSGGIGLGLAIVRRAAERDGGRVTLRNRAEGGLCAELVLPVE